MRLMQVCFAALLLVCSQTVSADPRNDSEIVEAAIADPEDEGRFAAYLAILPQVSNPLEKDVTFYLVEGDLPMTAKQVRAYLRSKNAAPVAGPEERPELLVHVEAGKRAIWAKPETRTLKYAVMRASFPNQVRYDQAVQDMQAATGDWVAACPRCDLSFVHVPRLDGIVDPLVYVDHLGTDEIRFVMIFSDVTAANPNDPRKHFIARAFFPSTPAHLRSIILDSSYFAQSGNPFTRVGVLRHELGHVLGYRHEHIRGVPGCRLEGNSWVPITPHDPKSVMHYSCGPAAARGDLVLSELDKTGHREVYALPPR